MLLSQYLLKNIRQTTKFNFFWHWRVISRIKFIVCKISLVKDGIWRSHLLFRTQKEWQIPSMSEKLTCELLRLISLANWAHTSTHSLLWIECPLAPATNSSFKSFLELVTKECVQNWVGCTVSIHQDLEIRLQDVHVSAGRKSKNLSTEN